MSNELTKYILTDEDGNVFEGVEVLNLTLKRPESDEEIEVLLLEDNEGTWFPFITSKESPSLVPVDDDDIISAIEDALDLIILSENEGEAD